MHSRKAISETVEQFWEMDTYTTYQLLEWVNEVIEQEKKEIEEAKKGNGGNSSSSKFDMVDDDPEMDSIYRQITNREDD